MLRSTSAVEVCEPTPEFENEMKEQCPDKTLLNDLSKGWTQHEIGHSKMGDCKCTGGDTEGVKRKNLPMSTSQGGSTLETFHTLKLNFPLIQNKLMKEVASLYLP